MNDRIKQIAFEAGQGGHSWYNDPNCLQAFAELIVRECAQKGFDVFDEEPDATCDAARYYVRDKIKEHFGVEE